MMTDVNKKKILAGVSNGVRMEEYIYQRRISQQQQGIDSSSHSAASSSIPTYIFDDSTVANQPSNDNNNSNNNNIVNDDDDDDEVISFSFHSHQSCSVNDDDMIFQSSFSNSSDSDNNYDSHASSSVRRRRQTNPVKFPPAYNRCNSDGMLNCTPNSKNSNKSTGKIQQQQRIIITTRRTSSQQRNADSEKIIPHRNSSHGRLEEGQQLVNGTTGRKLSLTSYEKNSNIQQPRRSGYSNSNSNKNDLDRRRSTHGRLEKNDTYNPKDNIQRRSGTSNLSSRSSSQQRQQIDDNPDKGSNSRTRANSTKKGMKNNTNDDVDNKPRRQSSRGRLEMNDNDDNNYDLNNKDQIVNKRRESSRARLENQKNDQLIDQSINSLEQSKSSSITSSLYSQYSNNIGNSSLNQSKTTVSTMSSRQSKTTVTTVSSRQSKMSQSTMSQRQSKMSESTLPSRQSIANESTLQSRKKNESTLPSRQAKMIESTLPSKQAKFSLAAKSSLYTSKTTLNTLAARQAKFSLAPASLYANVNKTSTTTAVTGTTQQSSSLNNTSNTDDGNTNSLQYMLQNDQGSEFDDHTSIHPCTEDDDSIALEEIHNKNRLNSLLKNENLVENAATKEDDHTSIHPLNSPKKKPKNKNDSNDKKYGSLHKSYIGFQKFNYRDDKSDNDNDDNINDDRRRNSGAKNIRRQKNSIDLTNNSSTHSSKRSLNSSSHHSSKQSENSLEQSATSSSLQSQLQDYDDKLKGVNSKAVVAAQIEPSPLTSTDGSKTANNEQKPMGRRRSYIRSRKAKSGNVDEERRGSGSSKQRRQNEDTMIGSTHSHSASHDSSEVESDHSQDHSVASMHSLLDDVKPQNSEVDDNPCDLPVVDDIQAGTIIKEQQQQIGRRQSYIRCRKGQQKSVDEERSESASSNQVRKIEDPTTSSAHSSLTSQESFGVESDHSRDNSITSLHSLLDDVIPQISGVDDHTSIHPCNSPVADDIKAGSQPTEQQQQHMGRRQSYIRSKKGKSENVVEARRGSGSSKRKNEDVTTDSPHCSMNSNSHNSFGVQSDHSRDNSVTNLHSMLDDMKPQDAGVDDHTSIHPCNSPVANGKQAGSRPKEKQQMGRRQSSIRSRNGQSENFKEARRGSGSSKQRRKNEDLKTTSANSNSTNHDSFGVQSGHSRDNSVTSLHSLLDDVKLNDAGVDDHTSMHPCKSPIADAIKAGSKTNDQQQTGRRQSSIRTKKQDREERRASGSKQRKERIATDSNDSGKNNNTMHSSNYHSSAEERDNSQNHSLKNTSIQSVKTGRETKGLNASSHHSSTIESGGSQDHSLTSLHSMLDDENLEGCKRDDNFLVRPCDSTPGNISTEGEPELAKRQEQEQRRGSEASRRKTKDMSKASSDHSSHCNSSVESDSQDHSLTSLHSLLDDEKFQSSREDRTSIDPCISPPQDKGENAVKPIEERCRRRSFIRSRSQEQDEHRGSGTSRQKNSNINDHKQNTGNCESSRQSAASVTIDGHDENSFERCKQEKIRIDPKPSQSTTLHPSQDLDAESDSEDNSLSSLHSLLSHISRHDHNPIHIRNPPPTTMNDMNKVEIYDQEKKDIMEHPEPRTVPLRRLSKDESLRSLSSFHSNVHGSGVANESDPRLGLERESSQKSYDRWSNGSFSQSSLGPPKLVTRSSDDSPPDTDIPRVIQSSSLENSFELQSESSHEASHIQQIEQSTTEIPQKLEESETCRDDRGRRSRKDQKGEQYSRERKSNSHNKKSKSRGSRSRSRQAGDRKNTDNDNNENPDGTVSRNERFRSSSAQRKSTENQSKSQRQRQRPYFRHSSCHELVNRNNATDCDKEKDKNAGCSNDKDPVRSSSVQRNSRERDRQRQRPYFRHASCHELVNRNNITNVDNWKEENTAESDDKNPATFKSNKVSDNSTFDDELTEKEKGQIFANNAKASSRRSSKQSRITTEKNIDKSDKSNNRCSRNSNVNLQTEIDKHAPKSDEEAEKRIAEFWKIMRNRPAKRKSKGRSRCRSHSKSRPLDCAPTETSSKVDHSKENTSTQPLFQSEQQQQNRRPNLVSEEVLPVLEDYDESTNALTSNCDSKRKEQTKASTEQDESPRGVNVNEKNYEVVTRDVCQGFRSGILWQLHTDTPAGHSITRMRLIRGVESLDVAEIVSFEDDDDECDVIESVRAVQAFIDRREGAFKSSLQESKNLVSKKKSCRHDIV